MRTAEHLSARMPRTVEHWIGWGLWQYVVRSVSLIAWLVEWLIEMNLIVFDSQVIMLVATRVKQLGTLLLFQFIDCMWSRIFLYPGDLLLFNLVTGRVDHPSPNWKWNWAWPWNRPKFWLAYIYLRRAGVIIAPYNSVLLRWTVHS